MSTANNNNYNINSINDDEEPNPEILNKDIIQFNKQAASNKSISNALNENNTNSNNPSLTNQQSKPSITIENKPRSKEPSLNQSLNVSKANTCACAIPSKFDNFDVQQLTYSIMKDYSQLRINKDENFMERMKFDIYKRQIKEDRINQLVDQNKLKLDESERIKAFNRLIEDANRRIEAQENLDKMKEKLEEDILAAPPKKYKNEEWKEIYNDRFNKYQEEQMKKKEEKVKEKQMKDRLKEEEEANLCKVKKAPQREIEETSKRLYGESIKRRLKMENKLSKVNYEQSPSKYKKSVINNNYNFQSDNEDDFNQGKAQNKQSHSKHQQQRQYEREYEDNDNDVKRLNASEKKKPKQAVSEYNNKRFEVAYNQIAKPQLQPQKQQQQQQQQQPVKREKVPIMQYNQQQQNYLEQYLEDEEIIKDIPKPVNNHLSNQPLHNDLSYNENPTPKKMDINQFKQFNYNSNSNTNDYFNNFKPNPIALNMKEKDANKIVDHFFNKKYKNL